MSFRNPAETHKKGLAQTDSTKMDVSSSVYEGEFTQMRDTAGVGAKSHA